MQIRLTPAVKVIMIACFALFVIQQTGDIYYNAGIANFLGLVPAGFMLGYRFWQIITYSFLHADVTHLVLNVLMLLFIGSEIELLWGTRKFLRFYALCAVAGGAAYLILNLVISGQGLYVPMVGASAAIYGLLMAYGLLFSERTLLFMMLFPMKAKHFIWILAGIEFMSTVFSSRAGVAGIAHLGGMAAGFAYVWAGRHLRGPRFKNPWAARRSAAKSRKADHLKLVVNRGLPKASDTENPDDSEPKTWH